MLIGSQGGRVGVDGTKEESLRQLLNGDVDAGMRSKLVLLDKSTGPA